MQLNVTDGAFRGATFDSRLVRPGMLFVALKGEKSDGHDYIPMALEKGAAGIVDGLDELQKLAHERRHALKAKVIGVTGSAGKTTTKELLKTFLACAGRTYGTEGNFNNHIGLPMTILNCPEDAEFLVLEMGSNHPGEIAALCGIADPDVGVVTGVGTAHLEFFRTREGIAEEKGTLLAAAHDFGVFPATDDFAAALAARGRVVVPSPTSVEGLLDPSVAWPPHFASNAALAFAVASRFGVTVERARAALSDFALPGARWRKVERDGVLFIDDTYNANPDSMLAALDALAATPCAGRRIAILGDMYELGEGSAAYHSRVFEQAKGKADLVLGVGRLSEGLAVRSYADVNELKPHLGEFVHSGDVVLLKASHGVQLGNLIA